MQVTLVYSPQARQVCECQLIVSEGSTVAQALEQSGWLQTYPELAHASDTVEVSMGIWGRKADSSTVLRDRDRIEFYRALRVDPKVARRERFSRQGTRSAGLFAKRRQGAKPGY